MLTFVILLAIYMLALIIISWQAGKNETKEDFLIAGRNRSWWQVGASKYAASIGAGWFIAYSGFAYEFGFPVFLIFGGAAGGVLLYAYWATPRIYESSLKAYTLGDYVENCTSSQVARNFSHYTALCMLVLNLLIAIVGGATLLHVFNIFSYEIGVLVMLVSVISYMLLAGFKAVMLTDIVQGALILLLLPVLVIGILSVQPIDATQLIQTREISWLGMAMLTVFGMVSVFADPTRLQVTFAGKNALAVKRGMLFTIIPMVLTGILIYVMSSAVYVLNPTLEAAAVFSTALQEYVPAALVPLGFIVFFIALMSTADSNLYALAAHAAPLVTRKSPSPFLMRMLLVGFGIGLGILSLLFRDVIDLAVLTGALLIVVAVPMIYLISGGRGGVRFVLLLAGGWVGSFLGVLLMGLEPDAAIFVLGGFIVSSIIPVKFFKRT